jgi:ComF family protein
LDHQTAKCNHDLAAAIDGFDYLYTYTDPIKGWISSLKYSKNFIAGRILQTLISLWLDNNNEKFRSIDHLVPIPISKRRLYLRGFNQTVYLLNTQTGLSLDLHCVKKIKHTPQQASLNRVERERIQKESFGVIKDLRGKKILLFDDVCTTGHTLAEISKSLKNDGVAEVHVLVLCRSLVQ